MEKIFDVKPGTSKGDELEVLVLVIDQYEKEYFSIDLPDPTKMFVFAMMYPNKKSADSLANIIKVDYPSVKVFPSQIYIGCMH